jgi:hypothetical protein
VSRRRLASVSVDLDDRWTYLQARGERDAARAAAAAPGFLPRAIAGALDLLARHGVRATFFVVGRDALRPELRASLAAVRAAGHELGNHSHDHLPWLASLAPEAQRAQIVAAEEAIAAATGERPRGFRGPGHAVGPALRAELAERGYLYDASPLPTPLAPLASWLYLRRAPHDEGDRRSRLGGGLLAGFASNRARVLMVGGRALAEVPVTTLPGLRLPIHFTYLQLLGARSPALERGYAALARVALRVARSEPSLLLHATDFLGREDGADLDFFPGMRLPRAEKVARVDRFLGRIAERYSTGALAAHAEAVLARARPADAPREAA